MPPVTDGILSAERHCGMSALFAHLNHAMEALLITSFAAGLVSTVNPCGFAMLPAYLGYFLGSGGASRTDVARRALAVSGLMSVGFLLVFGVAGLLLTLGVRAIVEFIPWMAIIVGLGLVVMGVRAFRGFAVGIKLGSGRVDRTSVLRFGISYGLASLSCTLPIFLALVAGAFSRASVVEGVSAFIAYGLGMSLVITAVTVTLAFGQERIIALIRSSARYVDKISGAVLTMAGLFIVWYWATVLSSGAVELGSNGLVRWVDRLSSSLTDFVADRPLPVAGALTIIVLGVVAMTRSAQRADAKRES